MMAFFIFSAIPVIQEKSGSQARSTAISSYLNEGVLSDCGAMHMLIPENPLLPPS